MVCVVMFFRLLHVSIEEDQAWKVLKDEVGFLAACRHLPTCLPAQWPLAANTTRLSITAEEIP